MFNLSGKEFQDEFDTYEKAKLYKAIGYDESEAPSPLPITVSVWHADNNYFV